jgi:hypothetical protein
MPRKRKLVRHEAIAQKSIAEYLRYRNVFFTISIAGAYLTVGQWAELIRQGYTSGTPDIFIFEPRGPYHGLFIELKKLVKTYTPKGKVKIEKGNVKLEQLQWQVEARKRGYKSEICFGVDEAIEVIKEYLDGK